MGEHVFDFLKQTINTRNINSIVTRAEIVKMLILKYKPGPKDNALNASIRTAVAPVFNELIIKGVLERVDRGKYKILKHIPYLLEYKAFRKAIKKIT